MRFLPVIATAVVLGAAACSEPEPAPPASEAPVEQVAESPVAFVERFFEAPGAPTEPAVAEAFLAEDVAAAIEAGATPHDFRRNLVTPPEADAMPDPPAYRFEEVTASEDTPVVRVTGGVLGPAMLYTLCRTGAGDWRIAEVEEQGHWLLRSDLNLTDSPVTCG
jgi:hypothetical protein